MRLVRIEWLKLKNYRTFYILIGLFTIISTLVNYGISRGMLSFKTNTMGKTSTISMISSDYTFPMVWTNVAYYLGWCILFVCVLIITSIANDYRYKTQRQHIIDGQSRLDYLHSKVTLVVASSVGITVLYILLCLIFGFVRGGGFQSKGMEQIAYVFIYSLNYLSFCALLALLIKRSGLTIMLLFAFLFVESSIVGIAKGIAQTNIGKFFPLESSDGLFPLPFSSMAKSMVPTEMMDTHYGIMLGMSCLYIVLYYLMARWRIQSADL